jgi:hypothetical protein
LPLIVRLSPRFAVMLGAMVLSICFLIVDIWYVSQPVRLSHHLTICSSVTGALSSSLPVGINPFWKLSFVFKCLTDCVVLDDFKTALDRLRAFKITRLGSFAADNGENGRLQMTDSRNGSVGFQHRQKAETPMPMPSPDGDELSHPGPWSNGKPDLTRIEPSKQRDRGTSQVTESSSDVEAARRTSDSPIMRPQSSWLRDSTEGHEYAQACREVTRSSHSDPPRPEPDTGIGRAR